MNRREKKDLLYIIICILIIILVCCGCKTQYVPVETVRIDTTYITKHQRDSIWLHDSIHVKEQMKGDTCYLEIEKWHIKYKEKERVDTFIEYKIDSIPQPYPVEKELKFRQKAAIALFPWVLALAILFGIYICRKPLKMLLKLALHI